MIKTDNIITVQGINNYTIDGTEAGTWTFKVIDNHNLLNDNIINKLEQFKEPIYFNDISAKHWIFDFKIENVWFEALNIDCCNMTMTLNAYN